MKVDDPARIDFRFYLVDAPKATYAYPLPSGLVLVPYQMVRRLENDSEVAAVLADAMAWLLEEQPVPVPRTNGQVAELAGAGPAAAIPIAGTAVSGLLLEQGSAGFSKGRRDDEQRARVSLGLMADAGFDVLEAPRAWWVLSVREPKQIGEKAPPEHVGYLYSVIAEREAGQDGALVGRGR